MRKMSLWGVGPRIMIPGYLILFILSWVPVKINIKGILDISGLYISAVSIILILIGIIMLAAANLDIKKAVNKNQLITTGLFSYIRNPMYGSHIFFIMPGVCLLTNNAVTLFSILCTLIIFYILIPKEEDVLEENFGEEYLDYKNKVRRLIPRLFI